MKKRKIMGLIVTMSLVTAGCSSSQAPAPVGGNEAQSQFQGQMSSADSTASAPNPGALGNGMYFESYGTNSFVSTTEDLLSTFAVDVDTGAYSVMRNYISRGSLPPESAVRLEEFINYFPLAYEPPKTGSFAIYTDAAPSPFSPGNEVVRIGIKGKEIAAHERKPANLVFVIDISGSMNQENRLGLVKQSLSVLVNQLTEGDRVGIVVYGSNGRRLLEPTSVQDKGKILASLDYLIPEGSTNAEEGLQLGYAMAAESFLNGGINRVILCSDGVANVGETRASALLERIDKYASDGILLSTFGFGMGNYNDTLMEQLADKGDGVYAYIDSFSEARRVFTEALTGTLQTIAKDAKIQVEFDPKQVAEYRLLGYENRDVADQDFRNDRVDGGEIGGGHSVTALYEVKPRGDLSHDLGKVRLRYQNADTGKTEEIEKTIGPISSKPAPELLFLCAVAQYAEILRGSPWVQNGSLESVLEVAQPVAKGEEQLEFIKLVKNALALRGR
ncbi:UNVERIFIED_CONTAM: Ca-activated chloride channel family protein [Brevibacillus sp. OAP136]